MADEDLLDLELEDKENLVEKRIKGLSEKVKLTSQERDELAKAKAELEAERDTISKERDFYASFSDSISKYPTASEYKESIKEKVMSGYTVEDATVAVLAKEGKLSSSPTPEAPKDNPAGGSAVVNPGSGEKGLDEMSRDEKRAALVEALGNGPLSR